MTRLPLLDAAKAEKALFNLGFEKVRQKGRHAFYRHPDGRTTTLPHHKGRDLSRSFMRQVLREIEVTPDDFISALERK